MTSSFRDDSRDTGLVDLRFVLRAIWRARWMVLGVTLLGAAYGAYDARALKEVFVASMLVSSESESAGLGASAAGEQPLGRLTQLVGGFTPQGPSTIDRLAVILGSVDLAARLQAKHRLLQTVYGSLWDETTQRWVRPHDSSSFSEEAMRWLARYFPRFRTNWSEPTIETLAMFLAEKVTLDKHKKLPFFEVAVRDKDPELALLLLRITYEEADAIAREQDRQVTDRHKSYIEAQLKQRTEVELRNVLLSLLGSVERRRMFLASDLPYVAKIVDPPRVRKEATGRGFGLNIIAFGLVAFLTAAILIGVRAVFRQELSASGSIPPGGKEHAALQP